MRRCDSRISATTNPTITPRTIETAASFTVPTSPTTSISKWFQTAGKSHWYFIVASCTQMQRPVRPHRSRLSAGRGLLFASLRLLPLLLDNRRRLLDIDVPECQELFVELLRLAALVVLVELFVEEVAEGLVVFAPDARTCGKRDDRLWNHHLALLHTRLLHH